MRELANAQLDVVKGNGTGFHGKGRGASHLASNRAPLAFADQFYILRDCVGGVRERLVEER